MLVSGVQALSAGQIGLETSARNVSQSSVPGYKRQVFSLEAAGAGPVARIATDLSTGLLSQTGVRGDLAIEGDGYFLVNLDNRTLLARGGQFARAADGSLTGASGAVLLDETGAPVTVATDGFEVRPDGTVVDSGLPVARLAVVAPSDGAGLRPLGGTLFEAAAVTPVNEPRVRQGMLELSNVRTVEEMTGVMLALRMAETGSRLIQAYDSLTGQAITTLGRGLR